MKIIEHTQQYWKNYVIALLLIIVAISSLGMIASTTSFLASSTSYQSEGFGAQQDMARSSYYPGRGSNAAPEEDDRMIAKNANLEVETDTYHESMRTIDSFVESYSAIVMSKSENQYNSNYYRAHFSFKVESSELDAFLNDLQDLGEVQSINVYSNDVTGVVIDLEERLRRYTEQIRRYEEMLTRSELSIEDEIKIQDRIDSLEQSISYLEERIQRQEEDVSYSDISFTLIEEKSLFDELDFLGFKDGFKLFLSSLELGIKFIVGIGGFIIPIAFVYGAYRVGRKIVVKK